MKGWWVYLGPVVEEFDGVEEAPRGRVAPRHPVADVRARHHRARHRKHQRPPRQRHRRWTLIIFFLC
jgi:hypothetical protein